MRTIILLLIVSTTAITSCKKEKQNTIAELSPEDSIRIYGDTTYYITGLTDYTMHPLDRQIISYLVEHNDGIQRKVDISLSGVPANVGATISKQSGYTPYSSSIELTTKFLPSGIYPVTVHAKPDIGNDKYYTINLTVEAVNKKECITEIMKYIGGNTNIYDKDEQKILFDNTYPWYDHVNNIFYLNRALLAYDPVNTLLNSYTSPVSVSAPHQPIVMDFDCYTGMFSIPSQTIKGYKYATRDTLDFNISGSGTVDIDNGVYKIEYTTDSGSFVMKGNFLWQ